MNYTVEKLLNKNLLKLQTALFTAITLFSVFFSSGFILLYVQSSPESLKINVNSADLSNLKKVPYIGEKTGKKIISIREKNGEITDLTQLKKLRYYNRFKYFLKVE